MVQLCYGLLQEIRFICGRRKKAVKIQVTTEDLQSAGKHATDNPISRALRRVTGQTWVIAEGSTAFLLTAPYRAVSLPYPVYNCWRQFQAQGRLEPFEFEFAADLPLIRAERGSDRRGGDRRQNDRRSGDRRSGERRESRDRRSAPRVAATV
jgi:hypothetical protein